MKEIIKKLASRIKRWREDYDKLSDMYYYELRGTYKNGIPQKEKLEALGLQE